MSTSSTTIQQDLRNLAWDLNQADTMSAEDLRAVMAVTANQLSSLADEIDLAAYGESGV